MAQVTFKRGLLTNLDSTQVVDGQLLITTDERALYLDTDGHRIRIGDFIEAESLEDLTQETPNTTALYYIKDIHLLAKYDSEEQSWITLNTDTGATSAQATGDANFTLNYDANGRKMTLTITNQVALKDDLGNLDGQTVENYVNAKVAEVSNSESNLQSTVEELSGRVDTIEGDYLKKADKTELENKIAAKADSSALTAVSGRVSTLETTVGTKEKGLVKDVADLQALNITETYATKNELSAESAKITALQTSDSSQNNKIETLETAKEDHASRIEELEGQIGNLSGAMHFKGVIEQDPAEITEGYNNGDVVLYGNKEYVFNNNEFVEFGDVTAEGTRITALETWKGTAQSTLTALTTFKDTTVPNTYATKASLEDYATKTQVSTDIATAKTTLQGESTNSIPVNTIGGAADAVLAKALAALEWGAFGAGE